jgi:hypothetical protein
MAEKKHFLIISHILHPQKYIPTQPMSRNPLETLKKGSSKFKEKIKLRKDNLQAKLRWKESISSADERWLDNEANTVDEQRVLDALESVSDYENRLQELDDDDRVIVKKLCEWAGDVVVNVTGNKRKRMSFHMGFGRCLHFFYRIGI